MKKKNSFDKLFQIIPLKFTALEVSCCDHCLSGGIFVDRKAAFL